MSAVAPVAVILPTLNAAGWLRRALMSLLDQGVDFEAVLVDGGSRDDTIAIANAFPGLRVVPAPGSSIYEALNRGIKETLAPTIVLLNADDVLLPGALTAWSDAFARAPEAEIALGQRTFVEIDAAGHARSLTLHDRLAARPLTLDVVLRGGALINSLCIRRSVFERIGRFDARYRFAADREWVLRAYAAGVAIVEVGHPVYRYTFHAGSSTMDPPRRNYAVIRREHLDIIARHLVDMPAVPGLRGAMLRWHAAETGMLAWHLARHAAFGKLATTLAESSRRAPGWPLTLACETARHIGRRMSLPR